MKKKILAFLLAVITLLQILPWSVLTIFAVDDDVIGATVRFKSTSMVYAYKNITTSRAESGDRVYPQNYPETLIVLDTVTVTNSGFTYYKLGTVDGSAHDALSVRPWFNSGDLEIVSYPTNIKPGVTLNGEAVEEIALFKDGKMPLTAALPEGVSAEVTWGWEILVDAESGTWAKIGDKVKNVCDITYALVVNVLNDNGEAKVRAVAYEGENAYYSDPVTVKMKYAPSAMEPVYENTTAENAPDATPVVAKSTATKRSGAMMLAADDTSAQRITITVNFIRVRADGTKSEAAYSDIRTWAVGKYDAYDVVLPAVLGYYPSLIEPSNPYDFGKNPSEDTELVKVSISADHTADHTINVYYYPGETDYKVYHFIQNVYNDGYSAYAKEPVTAWKGTVSTAVPENLAINISGHHHLYYERTEIAADGSTIIEIYYDREYYAVLFDLVKKGAYGQENLYVKYETEVGLSDPSAPGWKFSSWEEAVWGTNDKGEEIITGYKATDYIAGNINKHVVTRRTTFRAVWNGDDTSYSVVYWLENPNDGGYSVWYMEEDLKYVTTDNKSTTASNGNLAISGGYVKWNEVIPTALTTEENAKIYPYVSLNMTKTEEDWEDKSQGVLLEGDGSTTVDVYFNRRVYNITFEAVANENLTHKHENGFCIYNPMYCTHVHDDTCTVSTHKHTSACGSLTCGYATEHMHTEKCCDVHIHGVACYSKDADMAASLESTVADKVEQDIYDNQTSGTSGLGYLWGLFVGWIINTATGDIAADAALVASSKLSSADPPQNLQNGYVYIMTEVPVDYNETKYGLTAKGTIYIDVPAIYIDNGNDDPNDDWYYYTGNLTNGQIQEADSCNLPDHDHTSGCVYKDNCKTCENAPSKCSIKHKCSVEEHVHNDNCYTCELANGTCPHQHTASCYGNVCMVPTYDSAKGKTIINLQAKFGQDITEYLPYYIELQANGLHQDEKKNFVAWQYAGTGWADAGETHYVKHVTMVDTLCYSRGVTATAIYDGNANTPYLLYYLFESFDTTTEQETAFEADGSGRYKINGKWYDSDAVHMQLIMLSNSNATPQSIPGYNKKIAGMSEDVVGTNTATETITVAGVTVNKQFGYFYDRKTSSQVYFHNDGQIILSVPAEGQANSLKFGLNLGDLATALKNSAAYGNFDIYDTENCVKYPASLEKDAYVFDGWYTTPYKSEYTKVDWGTDTLPDGALNLYAHWKPVTRYVYVYEDSSLRIPFATDNNGYQEVGHRSFALEPDYAKSQYAIRGYKFDGWFYIDPLTGEETAFLFNFPITQEEIKIYAHWRLDQVVTYRINYVFKDANGNETKVASSLVGTAVAGQNKTFRALAGTALYKDYQEGFFPQIGSHTVQMAYDSENPDAVNEYTFYYDEVEKVKYWVNYVDVDTKEQLLPTQEYETRKAAVTERFLPVTDYTVDEYAKSLILSSQDQAENNVITFYYTKNQVEEESITVKAPWVVNHMIQNADGTYSVYQQEDGMGEYKYKKGETPNPGYYYGTVRTDIEGYTFDAADAKTRRLNGSVLEDIEISQSNLDRKVENGIEKYGYQLNEYGIEINLYYTRNKVGYTIVYKAADTGKNFHKITVPANQSVPHGDSVTVMLNQNEHMKIVLNEGYQLVDDTQTSITMTLYIDESRNVITFLYEKFDATFEYQIVCDDPNSGVSLSMTRDVIAAGSDKTLIGAIPYESETYYFAGWYADAACTVPVDIKTHSVTLVNEELYEGYSVPRLTPTKTSFTYEETSGNLYLSATYYALFLPRSANLSVTVTSGQSDSFILTFVGQAGTFAEGKTFTVAVQDGITTTVTDVPIGTYTVKSDAAWSWRYAQINTTVDVVVQNGGTLTLSVSPAKDKWLTDDASATITP